MPQLLPRTLVLVAGAGAVLALAALRIGVPAELILIAGCLMLVFRKHVVRNMAVVAAWGLDGLARHRFPGKHQIIRGINALAQTPWTRAAQQDQQQRRVLAQEQSAEQDRQRALRQRYKDAVYTDADAVAFASENSEKALFLVREAPAHRQSRSQLGGRPALPADVAWPSHDGLRLHFLAAIDLAELPSSQVTSDLPKDGVLFFFLGLADRWYPRVIYAQALGDGPTPLPADLPPINDYMASTMQSAGQTDPRLLPEWGLRGVEGTTLREPVRLPRDHDRKLAHLALLRSDAQFRATYHSDQTPVAASGYHHHMIGGPKSHVPNPTRGTGFKLLQLDSDTDAGLMWGDVGKVEFWIAPEDLRARNFEAAALHISSG